MTETPDTAPAKKRAGGLSSMLIADLKSMAVGMGISGASTMKKAQLVDAIKSAQAARAGAPSSDGAAAPARAGGDAPAQRRTRTRAAAGDGGEPAGEAGAAREKSTQRQPRAEQAVAVAEPAPAEGQRDRAKSDQGKNEQGKNEQAKSEQGKGDQRRRDGQGERARQGGDQPKQAKQNQDGQQGEGKQNQQNQQQKNRQAQQAQQSQQAERTDAGDDDRDDEGGSRRNRRRRGRDRTTRTGGRNEPDTTILEDDVLVPAAGILDVLDNYAFVRTSGYMPGADDVYLSLSLVKKYGLRRGDAVVGQVRQPREGERREKFNPMVRIDSVNGAEPDASKERPEFDEATPVHPDARLRLETTPQALTGRVLDVVAPQGKGQRTLVLAPAKAGTTVLLGEVARAVSANNPECHLMVVLVDERPEEVTDFQRAVKGEVVASTFDRPAADHTVVAELAVERAKRLVELGHDVVVLLDSLSRLTRAYNQTVAASGRDLAGGLEPEAAHAAKRLFGAARNIEDGGSLTMLATLTVDSGSALDEAVLEELLGTATSEVRLGGDVAAAEVVPAVVVAGSGTRREDVLLGEQEAAIVAGVRRGLAGLPAPEAAEQLVAGVAKARTNIEFLTQASAARR